MSKTMKPKSSVRISLNASMNDAVQFLQKTRYPFMKEDEIFKLAFSRLYASEYDMFATKSVGHTVLESIRKKRPDFAKEWLKSNGINEKSLSLEHLVVIIDELL